MPTPGDSPSPHPPPNRPPFSRTAPPPNLPKPEKEWRKKLTPEQQTKLTAAFNQLESDIWSYSKDLFDDAVRCNVGKEPCTTVKKFKMTEVPVKEADLKTVQAAVATVSLPAWSEVCNKSYAGCSDAWKKLIGPIAGIK